MLSQANESQNSRQTIGNTYNGFQALANIITDVTREKYPSPSQERILFKNSQLVKTIPSLPLNSMFNYNN